MAKKKTKVTKNLSDKVMSVEEIMTSIRKKHGETSIMTFKDGTLENVNTISFGSLAIDDAVGVGGAPEGRIIEIYGPESSGKTTICLSLIAQAQKEGHACAFIDSEHAFDPKYARNLGIDIDNLLFSQPDCGEDAIDLLETLILTNSLKVVVVDSVATLVPRAELEGEMGESHMGLQARLMSQALRKVAAIAKKAKTVVLFTNQLRSKIGVVYGSPEVTAGGNALKFYASIRMDVRKIGTKDEKGKKFSMSDSEGESAHANTIRVKVVKNKVAPPFSIAETDIYFGKGFDKHSEIFVMARKLDLIERKGGWYSYEGETIGQGEPAVLEALRNDEEWSDSLLKYIQEYDQLEDEDEELKELNDKLEELSASEVSILNSLRKENILDKKAKRLEKKLSSVQKKIQKIENSIEVLSG